MIFSQSRWLHIWVGATIVREQWRDDEEQMVYLTKTATFTGRLLKSTLSCVIVLFISYRHKIEGKSENEAESKECGESG